MRSVIGAKIMPSSLIDHFSKLRLKASRITSQYQKEPIKGRLFFESLRC
jgi:hypothetical protein